MKKRYIEKKNLLNIFITFIDFFSSEDNFLTKLDIRKNWINLKLREVREFKWISTKPKGCNLHFSLVFNIRKKFGYKLS